MEQANCPVCNIEFKQMIRYPNTICGTCVSQVVDENGNHVTFSIVGGEYGDIERTYTKNNITLTTLSNLCYINDIECMASEMRFGGIVVQAKIKK
jgi:hypothetical protein